MPAAPKVHCQLYENDPESTLDSAVLHQHTELLRVNLPRVTSSPVLLNIDLPLTSSMMDPPQSRLTITVPIPVDDQSGTHQLQTQAQYPTSTIHITGEEAGEPSESVSTNQHPDLDLDFTYDLHDDDLSSSHPTGYINQLSIHEGPWSTFNLRDGRVHHYSNLTELAEIVMAIAQPSRALGTDDPIFYHIPAPPNVITSGHPFHHTSVYDQRSILSTSLSTFSSQQTSDPGLVRCSESVQTTTSATIYTFHAGQEMSEQSWNGHQHDFDTATLLSTIDPISEVGSEEDAEDIQEPADNGPYYIMLVGAQFEDEEA